MHIELHPDLSQQPLAKESADLISACVHCGFCLATCPTYLDTRDERDSPRGRIYLIKELLETGEANTHTATHLDRCLTCRSCETTCPSGMQYGQLLDNSRTLIEAQSLRRSPERLVRWLLRKSMKTRYLFTGALRLGQAVRPLLPRNLKNKVPAYQSPGEVPAPVHKRRMLLLEGCVQRSATPQTNAAVRRVLDRLGVSLHSVPAAGCCGALDQHLGAADEAREAMRRNIDAWWPDIEQGAEAIISSASGCGVMLKDYGPLMANDLAYAAKAARISALSRDVAEVLEHEDLEPLAVTAPAGAVAVHTPCTLSHGMGRPTLVPELLARCGFSLAPTRDEHLCCGSAGTYSILQPAISQRLRERKRAALLGSDNVHCIATANIGCQLHLSDEAGPPVVHWIELLDNAFT